MAYSSLLRWSAPPVELGFLWCISHTAFAHCPCFALCTSQPCSHRGVAGSKEWVSDSSLLPKAFWALPMLRAGRWAITPQGSCLPCGPASLPGSAHRAPWFWEEPGKPQFWVTSPNKGSPEPHCPAVEMVKAVVMIPQAVFHSWYEAGQGTSAPRMVPVGSLGVSAGPGCAQDSAPPAPTQLLGWAEALVSMATAAVTAVNNLSLNQLLL